MDSRYRTYDKLKNNELPHRMGRGYGISDFITVGKLDNSRFGVYPYPTPNHEILKDFHFRDEGITFVRNSFLKVIDSLNASKMMLLDKQMEAEMEKLPIDKILENWKLSHGDEPPVFEVANEPNLFPYMSPMLYAYYYIQWWEFIKKKVPNAKIMNGGLFILDKLPEFAKKGMRYLGIQYKATYDYYMDFINMLKKVNYKYIPDILNLHIYPYVHTGGDDDLSTHFAHFDHLVKQLEGYYKEEVWITEFGNINPKNMPYTYNMIKKMLTWLEGTNVKRWYFYKVRGVDSNLKLLKEVGSEYYKKILIVWYIINIFLRIPMLFPFRNFIDRVLDFFKLPTVKEISMITKVVGDYIKETPIQSLVDQNEEPNIIGRYYISRALNN